ncbi:MAG: dihydrodipicolinate synthase family protein [Actinomycetota bacterium]|nr:dihydrodipicolinate synthase family protein [Actinomycetota bacterium]
MVRGALAAAVTPLRDGGDALDEDAFEPLARFLADAGLDGIFALGTTGEGLLLGSDERCRAAELFARACEAHLNLVVHCGAQTTADTIALAEHAAALGVDGVAVVAPPYFAFDDDALVAHFAAAARACAPTPFYLYEFEARVGYAIPVSVVERLREVAPNLAGAKVSDRPLDRFASYLLEGLDVFVGPEALIVEGLERGAAGAVSGLANAFPELVAALVRSPAREDGARVARLRDELHRFPFHAALKRVLALRGVAVGGAVRQPLRQLTDGEQAELDRAAETWLAELSPLRAR